MSLVNQMLKDLEQRRAPEGQQQRPVLGDLSYAGQAEVGDEPKRGVRLLAGTGLLLVLIAAAAWLGYRFAIERLPGPVVADQSAPVAAIDPVPEPAAASADSETANAQPPSSLVLVAEGEKQATGQGGALTPETDSIADAELPSVKAAEADTTPVAGLQRVVKPALPSAEKPEAALAVTDTKPAPAKVSPAKPPSKKPAPEVEPVQHSGDPGTLHKKRREPSRIELAQVAMDEGLLLLRAGRPLPAREKLTQALQLDPRLIKAREALALLQARGGSTTAAIALLREGLRLQPQVATFSLQLAKLLQVSGDLEGAITVLETQPPAIAEVPDHFAMLAALYQKTDRFEQAASVYQALLQQDAGSGLWWLGLAVAEEGAGNASQAQHAYQRAWNSGNLTQALVHFVGERLSALREDS